MGELIQSTSIPEGFENLGLENLNITELIDLTGSFHESFKEWLKKATVEANPKIGGPSDYYSRENLRNAIEAFYQIKSLYHLKIPDEGSSKRDIVLMEDDKGKKAMVFVFRDKRIPKERNKVYGQLEVIGGCGLYDTPVGKDKAKSALEHTKLLSVVMARKCFMAGLELGGMKATIPGEMDWEGTPVFQIVTGWLFSPKGPFKNAITGTDARQTPLTIARMAKGSEIGGNHQIAGTIEALDTPGFCRFSLDETYKALFEKKEELEKLGFQVPRLEESTVLVEGFGRIGRTAVRLMLDKSVKGVIISDPLLTDEDEKLPESLKNNPQKLQEEKERVRKKLEEMKKKYGQDKINVVRTDELSRQEALILLPCSTAEGNLTEEKIDQLQKSGVKLILSGANNPFGQKDLWRRAKYAADQEILMPPEILANCGSVTAASMEPLFRARLVEKGVDMNNKRAVEEEARRFAQEVVIPHIAKNTREKLDLLIKIANLYQVDLYQAGEIAYLLATSEEGTEEQNIFKRLQSIS